MRLLIHGNQALERFPYELLEDFIKEYYPSINTIVHNGCYEVISQIADNFRLKNNIILKKPSFSDAQAIFVQNIAMLENCDTVLVIWDGGSQNVRTVIKNAKRMNKPVKVYSTQTGVFSDEILTTL